MGEELGSNMRTEKRKIDWSWVVVISVVLAMIGLIAFGWVADDKNSAAQEVIFKEQRVQVMENIGGNLETVPLGTYEGTSALGKISGNFVFFAGVFEGKSVTMIRFSWQSREGISYIAEVPANNFQRIKPSIDSDQILVDFNLELPDSWSQFKRNNSLLSDKYNPQLKMLTINQLIEEYSKFVSVTMNDAQYSEFLKNITY